MRNPRRSEPTHPTGGLSGVVVTELLMEGEVPRWVHPEWREKFPWLAQGITGGATGRIAADFALFKPGQEAVDPLPWNHLAEEEGLPAIVHSRQIHGTRILVHDRELMPPGVDGRSCRGLEERMEASIPGGLHKGSGSLRLGPEADGHLSDRPGLLMGITVADCVPVFLVDPATRVCGLIHAGWRGVAGGILEGGLEAMVAHFHSRPKDVFLHLGPSICGECYEVGPEVHAALSLPTAPGPTPVDLRTALAHRAIGSGISPTRITRSAFCTRCQGSPFFSHRRGDRGRQVGYLGRRE